MIASSEDFLAEIRPPASGRHHLRAAAIQAAYRFDRDWDTYGSPRPLPVSSQRAALHGLAYALGRSTQEYSTAEAAWVADLISIGIPLVGWAINADSRRIDGGAQPGESHFIKYLGRSS